jgi:hypothetical protein
MAINMSWRPATADWALEETDNPLYAQDRGFYEVVKWMRDGMKVDRILYAGSSLGRAQEIFPAASSTGRVFG